MKQRNRIQDPKRRETKTLSGRREIRNLSSRERKHSPRREPFREQNRKTLARDFSRGNPGGAASDHNVKAPFPSERQSKAKGVFKEHYPAYLRDLVDCDYSARLSQKDRIWLGAFLQEYYAGFWYRSETQVMDCQMRRQSTAARMRAWRNTREGNQLVTMAQPLADDDCQVGMAALADGTLWSAPSLAKSENQLIREIDRANRRSKKL